MRQVVAVVLVVAVHQEERGAHHPHDQQHEASAAKTSGKRAGIMWQVISVKIDKEMSLRDQRNCARSKAG